MIITCPQCKTRYRLADDLLTDQESKVRCSRCQHVFHAFPAELSPVSQEDSATVFQEPRQESDSPAQDPETAPPETKTRSRKSLLLLILLLLLLMAVGVYLSAPQLKTLLPFWGQSSSPTSLAQRTQSSSFENLEQITFSDVRQYMVDNEKIGKLLIIEGTAVNESQVAVEMIKIQSEIYDEQGQTLQRQSFYCGNTLSSFQLQVLDQKEMSSALKSKVGILTHNSNLSPGQEVPFMSVFFNPPEAMAEFSLKVIQAKAVQE